MGLTYDTGMLLAAEKDRPEAWQLHRRALERRVIPVVPAPVLAQAWRGGPQASLSRLLTGCRIEPFDEALARHAGRACARSRTSDIVDAGIVLSALARGDLVVTSDPDDLLAISGALRRRLAVHRI